MTPLSTRVFRVRPARLAAVPAAPGPTLNLYALLLAGIALRVLAAVSWWPVVPTLDDAYSDHTGRDAFSDPLDPAGYGLILGALGTLTLEPAIHVALQHLLGLASALLLYSRPGASLVQGGPGYCRRHSFFSVPIRSSSSTPSCPRTGRSS
jgi:hypothetical protein